jgi:hypothetical protein
MADDIAKTRLKLAEIVMRAETDEQFRKRLKDDSSGVLAEHGIPQGAVEEFSQAIGRASGRDESQPEEACIHTKGCNDFTFSSDCGPTCFVTIKIEAPDA